VAAEVVVIVEDEDANVESRSLAKEVSRSKAANAGTDYDQERWEGVARDGHSLSYGPPQRLSEIGLRWQLQALPYDLGISDVAAVVGHRDVLSDPSFATAFQTLLAALRTSPLGSCSQIQWLL